jgi:uncharacterized protein involved in exopolysaccharide biosynthesis
MDNKETNKFSAVDLILFAWEKRVPLIMITLIAAIISIIVSFMITPMFKSTVVLFPAPALSVSKTLLSDNYAVRGGLLTFGEEEQADQLLQILNSDQIRSTIIDKYNLMEHYEIDQDAKYPRTALTNEFDNNINFRRTEYMSVLIEVLDKDPKMAADIANDIAALIDTTMNRIQKDRAFMALQLVQKEYNDVDRELKILEDSLKQLQRMGIHDYESQSEVVNDAYAIAVSEGNLKGAQKLQEKLDQLAEYGGAYVSVRDQIVYEKDKLSHLKTKLIEARVEVEQNLPHKFVVDSGMVPERKAYPKKAVIVIVSTFSAFILGLIILILIDNWRKITVNLKNKP